MNEPRSDGAESSVVQQDPADNRNGIPLDAEWLEADGLGGFASGTVDGIRTRRYHALLLSAATPPTGRVVLVNDIEVRVETDAGSAALSAQRYDPDTVCPNDAICSTSFDVTPWPHWKFAVGDGTVIEQEVFVARDSGETVLRWRRLAGSGGCRLVVRPLLSGRDYHALHRVNSLFNFTPIVSGGNVAWRPYPDLPAITALTNGDYTHQPVWYYNFLYSVERDRGLDHIEDLASPGAFTWDLSVGDAVLILRSGDGLVGRAAPYAMQLAEAELLRRDRNSDVLSLPAESYLVDRGHGRTLLAGFPWFTDWGRDTFIAMRGLVITTSRLADAEAILVEWAHTVNEGMLPNRFPDGGAAEYNSVDASLWFIIAVHDFLAAAETNSYHRRLDTIAVLRGAVLAILEGYARGTRYGIRLTGDGLLAAGVPGVQLTWMDAKLGDWVVTPRIGKPVEVQAIWINALRIGGTWSEQWLDIEHQARASFARFYDPATGGLYDVLDADGVAGSVDRRIRPNQILAVGGLPFQVLKGATARAVVDLAERELLTPLGLRSLARSDPDYQPFYRGGPAQRDRAYHQGTVWPWLIGPFTEAWLRTREDTEAHKAEAKRRFLAPLLTHLGTAGLGHVSEVADAEPPHEPGGCPFQAWSLGELIRALDMVEPARRVN